MAFFTTGAQLQAAINALPDSKKGKFTPFDGFFYGSTYLQNYSGTLSPLEHFVQIGAERGFAPNAQFDPAYYKNSYADLASFNNSADLLIHFLRFGLDEGRAPNATLADFNGSQYLANNPDVAAFVNANLAQFGGSVSNGALAHFVKFGQAEGRSDVDTGAGATARLTTGQDVLTGTANNDVFTANAFDNQNTFQTGDEVNGGAGTDTLNITLGNSSAFAIAGITNSVEVVNIRSQSNNSSGNNGDNNVSAGGVADGRMNDNTVDAQDMIGVTQWWNVNSRADLVIEDVRIANNQLTKDVAIGWADADPSSVNNNTNGTPAIPPNGSTPGTPGTPPTTGVDKVDYEVYFSPESLRKAANTTSNAITLSVGNQVETPSFDAANPLKDIPYTDVAFVVNGTGVNLDLNLTGVTTYDQLFVAVQAAFAAAQASTQFGAALAGVTLSRTIGTDSFFSKDGVLRFADEYVLTTANGTITPAAVGWFAEGGLPSNNAFGANVVVGDAQTTSGLITSTIFLDNVGRESEAGDLVIGSMSTRTGVERFDITVLNNDNTSGEYTSSGSWVGEMRSTNNFLREVVAVNGAAVGTATGALADYLYVGTGQDSSGNNLTQIREVFQSTQSTVAGRALYQTAVDRALLNTDGLVDVRLFDASAMTGQVKVGASITATSIRKYQDLLDSAVTPATDDVEFQYLTGSGNDAINLAIDGNGVFNNAAVRNTARDDFDFLVDGGAGNDRINVTLTGEDSSSGSGALNWYINQKINGNITVNGGAGDDIITTPGWGDMIINGGTGNDTIYTDNTGNGNDFSTWVFNAASGSLSNLESQAPAAVSAVNAQLTVTFRGLTKTVDIANSAGSLTNVRITDLDINQAIKNAINNDPVLNKLLVAQDQTGRTLVVESLIDGTSADLTVAFSTTPFTASQLAAVSAGLVGFTAAATGFAAVTDGYVAPTRFAGADDTGSFSVTATDNTITGGTGNDMIVLSTTTGTSTLTGSNETVVYNAAGFGDDVIVNFDAGIRPPGTFNSTSFEIFTATFSASDGSPAAQTVIFDGVTVNLAAPTLQGIIPVADVVSQFVNQYNAAGNATYAAAGNTTTGVVTFTKKVPGAVTDVTAAAFTGTYVEAAATGGGGTVTPVTVTTQGVDNTVTGSVSTFTVTYDAATTAVTATGAASNILFAGANVALAQGDGSVTVATKVNAATYTGWSTAVVHGATSSTVTFTAAGPNAATPIGTDSVFKVDAASTLDGVTGSLTGTVGVADSTTPPVQVPGGPSFGSDTLDFTLLGGSGAQFAGASISEINKSITVVGQTTANDTAVEIAALYTNDSLTKTDHIYIAVNAANKGFVYQVTDAAGLVATTGNTTATLVGTIDLADTPWGTLTAVNFVA